MHYLIRENIVKETYAPRERHFVPGADLLYRYVV